MDTDEYEKGYRAGYNAGMRECINLLSDGINKAKVKIKDD
jgi:hypothetical protein